MPNVSNLIKKQNKIIKCFPISYYNKFTTEILDAKLKYKKIVNESDISEFINNIDLDKKIKKISRETGLKAEQPNMKLQIYDSSNIGQSYFINDGSQVS